MGVKRLDDLQVGEVGFIKIDVEGHDSLCYEVPLKRCGATDRCSSSRRKSATIPTPLAKCYYCLSLAIRVTSRLTAPPTAHR